MYFHYKKHVYKTAISICSGSAWLLKRFYDVLSINMFTFNIKKWKVERTKPGTNYMHCGHTRRPNGKQPLLSSGGGRSNLRSLGTVL